LAFTGKTRSETKASQPDSAARKIHQDICRFDVLVDQTSLVEFTQGICQTDSDMEKSA
jgi:hypothetical protein